MMNSKPICDSQNTLSLSSKKQLLEQLRREQQEVNAITQPLLETEARFIKDLDLYLTHKDTLNLRKRKLLHKRWTQNVWLPIQQSIQQHFMEHGYNEMQKMRSMHAHYIDYCNAKGFVFLESYDPLEYNPFLHYFSTPQYHKISTPALEDPLSLHSRTRIKEKTTILRCQTGHIYQRQQVEEILQSPPASQQSFKQARTSRDSGSLRLWEDCRSRTRGTTHATHAERRGFHRQCCSSYA
ncbi:protein FAM228A isoform X1 [Danio rerio]|uniref:Family with sequence similarity 228 member A n=3 Tax=Danio rerio TaxID=7955 RepID=Q5RI30_DANRE|nr:protein FAM228B isoform X1 [Danio rerio]|eukprot:XP_021324177.1 protein FAM228B isoform X1 [Danio rerio]